MVGRLSSFALFAPGSAYGRPPAAGQKGQLITSTLAKTSPAAPVKT